MGGGRGVAARRECAGGEKPLVISESVAPCGLRCCSGSFSKPSSKRRREAGAAPVSQEEENSLFIAVTPQDLETLASLKTCRVSPQSRCNPHNFHRPRTTARTLELQAEPWNSRVRLTEGA